jgi:hypothetical protein
VEKGGVEKIYAPYEGIPFEYDSRTGYFRELDEDEVREDPGERFYDEDFVFEGNLYLQR